MPAPVAQLVDGATAPALTITFSRNGVVQSLNGYTSVVATVKRPVTGLATLNKPCVILNPPANGQVQLQWAAGDLSNPGPDVVEYTIDFALTDSNGNEEKPPLPITVTVRPSTS